MRMGFYTPYSRSVVSLGLARSSSCIGNGENNEKSNHMVSATSQSEIEFLTKFLNMSKLENRCTKGSRYRTYEQNRKLGPIVDSLWTPLNLFEHCELLLLKTSPAKVAAIQIGAFNLGSNVCNQRSRLCMTPPNVFCKSF